jgi:hypothetical protein
MDKRQTILNTITDMCSDFLYYDRKEDEELSPEDIDDAIESGAITIEEIVQHFKSELEKSFNES